MPVPVAEPTDGEFSPQMLNLIARLLSHASTEWVGFRAIVDNEDDFGAFTHCLRSGLIEARAGIRVTDANGLGFVVPVILAGKWEPLANDAIRPIVARRVCGGQATTPMHARTERPSLLRLTADGERIRDGSGTDLGRRELAAACRRPGKPTFTPDGEEVEVGPAATTPREAIMQLLDAVQRYGPARRRYFQTQTGIAGGPWRFTAKTDGDAIDTELTPIVHKMHPQSAKIANCEWFVVTDAVLELPCYYAPLLSFRMATVADDREPEPHTDAWYAMQSVRQALERLREIGRTMLRTIPAVLTLAAEGFDVTPVARLRAALPDDTFMGFGGPHSPPQSQAEKDAISAADRAVCAEAEACLAVALARLDAPPRPRTDDGVKAVQTLTKMMKAAKAVLSLPIEDALPEVVAAMDTPPVPTSATHPAEARPSESRTPAPAAAPKRKGGRPRQNNVSADEKLLADWRASGHSTFLDFANARRIDAKALKAAIDRAEKREARARRVKGD